MLPLQNVNKFVLIQKTPVWFVSALVAYSDFRMALKNGFGKCSLFDLSANGWKEPNIDSSFSRQRKP